MALKPVNFKLEEKQIEDMKHVAAVLNMNYTDVVRGAIDEYLDRMHNDPYYRLTAMVEEADPEESEEILSAVNEMSDEDMKISVKKTLAADVENQTEGGDE